MKNSIVNSRGPAWVTQSRLAVLLASGGLLLQSFGAGPPGTAERSQLDFPPRPPGLTNRPTMSQPEIELSSTLAAKLGGQDIASQLVPSIAHFLNQSERFTLTRGQQARCRCIVRLTELAIHKVAGKSKFDIAKATPVFGLLLRGKDPGITSQLADLSTNINWSDDKLQVGVRCAVSVEIVDRKSDVVLAEDIGEETRTNTAKAIGLEVMGLAYAKADGQDTSNDGNTSIPGSDTDFQNGLIKLATYHAICNLLPKLDKRLLELGDPPAVERGLNEDATTASSSSPGKLFCSNCGKAANAGDKFCTSCGTRLSR
jgi:hypothetical protein